jgi:plastocyanin
MSMTQSSRLAIRAGALGLLLLPILANAADTMITIDNFTFTPGTITVAPGTRVVWLNRDDIPHLVVGKDNPGMKSEPLDTGNSFAFTFAQPGTYHYFCGIHPTMQGTVVVR